VVGLCGWFGDLGGGEGGLKGDVVFIVFGDVDGVC